MLTTFKCSAVDNTWWLDADRRLQCFDGDWVFFAFVAVGGVIVYPVGIMAYMASTLFGYDSNELNLDLEPLKQKAKADADVCNSMERELSLLDEQSRAQLPQEEPGGPGVRR